MILLSCVNCCHNPLQSDSLGTAAGYCTEHGKVLLAATQLTCGRHLRKDLPAGRAIEQRGYHERRFSPAAVTRLVEPGPAANGGYTSASRADVHELSADEVGEAVLDYGRLTSKIGSLAQLRRLPGPRAEVAMLSLGRAYVNRRIERDGRWTSGLHLLWWTRRRLLDPPAIAFSDLRAEGAAPLSRQVALAAWQVVMTRVLFIGDVGFYARGVDRRIARLAGFTERAAEDVHELSPAKLIGWQKREGTKLVDSALPESRYEKLAAQLREEGPAD